ncbi:hypothetical protein BDL97_04G126300 [Sphagnum fallax]|uniref:EB1 C-terminal domain-containing protein n=1 Tax=Sphagnum jensenii TaxID=128206 RepID=A0ABP1BJE4_9BRYO|nr:hypothetical protein BDL97_04G126300 [Sphagnum fallax]
MGKKSSLVAHRILSQRKLVPELHDDRGGGLCKEPTLSTDSCSKDVLHSELLAKKRDDEGGSKLGPIKEQQENPAHQQAILQSLASYLEGELITRLQSYSTSLAEVEAINKERLFYHNKLIQIEKMCERAQPYASTAPLVESVISILGSTTDRPSPC